jgi:hypothetical protein
MPKPFTFCVSCDHVCADTRKLSPWQWRCVAAPKTETDPALVYVDPTYIDHPYHKCAHVNDGACEHFTPLRSPSQ